ncbi:hypothetical protein SAMN02745121_00362 [Nannocystis exedens]|uniref:Uncharacterized protein n=2 Tax=Nannocystis exedens TaxID=54 RepID=A0A1I1SYE3_9BACT|nr:hypothetical protein NAEX_09506 [Nannocystis exedens]SFD51351.1 hypothetical protein SAMN02745121_00362 [Nannocystis exedens]
MAGCFHDRPPQLGCATEAACSTTSTTSTSTTTDEPTTSTSTTGASPEPRTFRIDSLRLVDPHLFSDICFDVTGLVNMFGLTQQIADGELNLVLHFADFDPAALAAVLGETESCDLAQQTCVPAEGVSLQLPVEVVTEAPCLALDPAVFAADNVSSLHAPEPTCFRTSAVELALPLGAADAPLNMLQTQVTFNFDDAEDPQAIVHGVVSGFLTRASAETVDIEVSGATYNLWAMVQGPEGCAESHPDLLPSVDELAGPDGPIEGVWLAFNATASRVALVPP